MSFRNMTGALSRGRSQRIRAIATLAFAVAALATLIGAGSASAAFTASAGSVTPSSPQAGGHPTISISASDDPVAGDLNGDDLSTLSVDLPAGMLVNPQAVATPCPTATFNADGCAPATQVGQISVTYRVAGKLYTSTGSVYSITPDANSVINFGFVVRPTTSFQKFLFASGKAIGLTTVRQGLDADYGLTLTVSSIPRTIKSTIGTSTAMTISNIKIDLNPRAGATQNGGYFTFNPTRCTTANSRTSFTSYAGVTATKASSFTLTGCDQLKMDAGYKISTGNTNAGQATSVSATVTMPTADAPVQQTHISDVMVTLNPGTTINAGTIGALATCSDAQLTADACPAGSRMGSATVNVPFLPAPMTGDIYLTNPSGVKFAYILRGARGTTAILRGYAQPGSNGIEAYFQALPQVPWSSATLNFTTQVINNPAYACPNATSWAYINGYSGAQLVTGAFYAQTNCPPPDTAITSTLASPTKNRTPQFSFSATPASGSTFQCSLDSAAYAACSSPFTTPSLADGTHSFAVRAVYNGVPDPTPASVNFRVDTVPPAITIASPAAGATLTDPNVTLAFTTEPGATNYCWLDAGTITICSSPKTFTGAADGAHTITMLARDTAGNIATATRSFTIAVPKTPVITLNSPVTGSTLPTSDLVPDFTVTSPNGTPISSVTCTLFVVYGPDPEDEYQDGTVPPWACKSGDRKSLSENYNYRLQIDAVDANGLASAATTSFTTGIDPPMAAFVNEADSVAGLSITDRTPTFRLAYLDKRWPNLQFDCSLVAGSATPVWSQCGTQDNLPPFEQTTPLANGSYTLWTRTRSGSVTGNPTRMDFTVGDWSSTYTAGTTTQQAGAHPDLDIDITPTGAGQMHSVDMSLPKSLIGSLNSFPECPAANVPTGTCPAATKVGSVDVKYTVHGGVDLKRTPGDVYYTGPQVPGDTAGLVINVFGPIAPYADVIIPLRIQLTNNSQTMRVFSDTIPTDVGNIHDATKFIKYWLIDFKMHINGSTGSPYPLLTNPSSCAAGQFSNVTGDTEGNKTTAQTIAYQATGCSALPFAPTIAQSFSSTAAGDLSGVTADVAIPSGSSSFKSLKVLEPGGFGPNSPSFGAPADQCPASAAPTANSIFDAANCPASSIVGTMSIDSPLLTSPLTGTVYLVNKSPLPWLGVKLDQPGIAVRLVGVTSVPQVDPACDPSTSDTGACPTQIAVTFSNLPDLPATHIKMVVDGPARATASGGSLSGKILAVAQPNDPACVPSDLARTTFAANSGAANVSATQQINFSGCLTH